MGVRVKEVRFGPDRGSGLSMAAGSLNKTGEEKSPNRTQSEGELDPNRKLNLVYSVPAASLVLVYSSRLVSG